MARRPRRHGAAGARVHFLAGRGELSIWSTSALASGEPVDGPGTGAETPGAEATPARTGTEAAGAGRGGALG
jgi:hypothetical protein